MIGTVCFIIFLILNFVNNCMLESAFGNYSLQSWIGLLCTCGCYLAGCIHYMFKNKK